ncbi:MAG: OmpH family outer membrane protein [Phycisphaerales bacterium]
MNRSTIAACLLGSAIAATAFLAGTAEARRPHSFFAPPAAVGVVDMATVFDRLAESAEWDVKLRSLESRFSQEAQQRRGELEAMAKEIEAMADGPAKAARVDEARLKQLQLEQWVTLKQLELDREKSLKWQSVYRAVREGSRKLAENEKYDLIIVDDSRVEIRTRRDKNLPPLEDQAQSQISQLRILYAGRSIDVTEKLIVQINNARTVAPAAPAASR